MRFELHKLTSVALGISVLLLAACGGGGGSSSSATASGNGAISGVASKGLMVGAKVTAYCGVAPTTPIGTFTTLGDGSYALALTQACAKPIEVVVSAVSGTTMLDEIQGSISVPTGFSMRAFVPPSTGGTISQPITPLTDMAASLVETAVTANTTLSTAVVSNANSAIISTVLGGNAALFTAVPLAPSHYSDSSTTSEQQQLITLLSSISAAAQSQPGATPGDKIKAVLDQLAAQANSTIPAVTATNYMVANTADVNATSGAHATPLATIKSGLAAITAGTSVVQGGAAVADAVKTNVATFQIAVVDGASSQVTQGVANGTVTPPNPAGATLTAAIASAKLLFANFRANILTLADPTSPSWLQTKLKAVQTDFNSLNMAGTYSPTDLVKASQRATALLVEVNRALAAGMAPVNAISGSDVFGDYYQRKMTDDSGSSWTCTAYYTAKGTVTGAVDQIVRSSPVANNGGFPVATCNHYIYSDGVSQMQFQVRSPAAPTSVASGASFVYVNRIRKWASSTCTDFTNAACAVTFPDSVQGNLSATWDSAALLKTMHIAPNSTGGNVISYRTPGTPATLALDYTLGSAGGVDTIGFTGSLTDGDLYYGFQPGTTIATTASTTPGSTFSSVAATLVGRIQTAAFQYNGTFGASGNTVNTLGTVNLAGSIATVSGSTVTPFLEGTLSGNATNQTIAFSGKVSNGASVNNVSATGNASVPGQQDISLTYTFPGYSITVSGHSFDDVTKVSTGTLTSSNGTVIAVTRSNGNSALVVRDAASNKIGDLVNGNTVNFVDNSFIVLN